METGALWNNGAVTTVDEARNGRQNRRAAVEFHSGYSIPEGT